MDHGNAVRAARDADVAASELGAGRMDTEAPPQPKRPPPEPRPGDPPGEDVYSPPPAPPPSDPRPRR
jgi:hypothetical protein